MNSTDQYFLQFGSTGQLGLYKQPEGQTPIEIINWDADKIFRWRGYNPTGFNIDAADIKSGWYWVNPGESGGTYPVNWTWGLLVHFYIDAYTSGQLMLNENGLASRVYVNHTWTTWIY